MSEEIKLDQEDCYVDHHTSLYAAVDVTLREVDGNMVSYQHFQFYNDDYDDLINGVDSCLDNDESAIYITGSFHGKVEMPNGRILADFCPIEIIGRNINPDNAEGTGPDIINVEQREYRDVALLAGEIWNRFKEEE